MPAEHLYPHMFIRCGQRRTMQMRSTPNLGSGAVESCATNKLSQQLGRGCGSKWPLDPLNEPSTAPAPDNPTPEKDTAARGWDQGGGKDQAGKLQHPPSKPRQTRRQEFIDLAEAVFNRDSVAADIDGAHHVDHPDRRRKTR